MCNFKRGEIVPCACLIPINTTTVLLVFIKKYLQTKCVQNDCELVTKMVSLSTERLDECKWLSFVLNVAPECITLSSAVNKIRHVILFLQSKKRICYWLLFCHLILKQTLGFNSYNKIDHVHFCINRLNCRLSLSSINRRYLFQGLFLTACIVSGLAVNVRLCLVISDLSD